MVLGGTDDVQAQALIYSTSDHPLVGEEVYASGAYLKAGELHNASLRTQDILRFGIIILILLAVVLKTVGVL